MSLIYDNKIMWSWNPDNNRIMYQHMRDTRTTVQRLSKRIFARHFAQLTTSLTVVPYKIYHLEVIRIIREGEKKDMLSFENARKLIYRSDEILDFDVVKENKVDKSTIQRQPL